MRELWKSIKNYEGLYEISNYGHIRSLDRYVIDKGKKSFRKGTNISICKNEHGYKYVTLYKDGKQKHKYLHRLVAEAFIDNPNNYPEVNHLDFDKSNNYVTNLEWCSKRCNMNHAHINGKLSNKQNNIPIIKIGLDGTVLEKYPSFVIAAESVKGIPQNISQCCNHKTMSVYGYYWEYDDGNYDIGSILDIDNRKIIKSKGRTSKPVAKIDMKTNKVIAIYPSMKSAGEDNHCQSNYIGKCCNGRIGEYRGYKWHHAKLSMRVGDIID